jgi:hypothetical protein
MAPFFALLLMLNGAQIAPMQIFPSLAACQAAGAAVTQTGVTYNCVPQRNPTQWMQPGQ